ncbi:EGF-like domain protein [Dictyocaulus viviparus]|uniref:EGF-like domain protein n=1 Tax=Dictyocaulus viviparus TaxID=29172 RepID=A0A0D8X877_DICVI|nr:EGF-like domain protein [Dictyocaulus viviparus]
MRAHFVALKEKVEQISSRQEAFKSRIDSHQSTLILVATASRRLLQSAKNFTTEINQLQEWRQNKAVKDVKLRRLMGRLQKSIKLLTDMLAMDGCEDKPCKHGGTCLPRFGKKYNCLCPTYRTGDNCEIDIDECALYDGTHAGCQNNATCVNHNTGFRCNCQNGFHGPLCQYRQSTCSRSIELCGPYGHCIDVDTSETESTYKCICDWGYKVSDDKINPICVDIDECQDNPCHPGVDCINLPGKFQCTGCPKGYHGNGQICADIDECAAETYPCSTNPRVPCYNTIGSFYCGSCPAGYHGDGRSCRPYSACNDAPCHPEATCVDDKTSLNPGGFICHCPVGTIGDGIGENGCQKSNSTVCIEGNCMNGGTCLPLSESQYRCLCPEFYYGIHCEQVSACIGNPCQNDGICENIGVGKVKCLCPIGFYGSFCQFEENSCGAHYTESIGNLTFPMDADKIDEDGCDIIIATGEENSALRITFDSFKTVSGAGLSDCSKASANLTLFDGVSDNSPIFATFCHEPPVIGEAITMTSSSALLRYKGSGISFSLKWETKKRECGYRTNLPSGVLLVPPHHLDTVCEWFISAPFDKHLEIEIPTVEMTTGFLNNCSVNQLEVFDGYTSYDSHRILHICETTNVTSKVRSTGPFMTISFRSNVLGGSKSALQRGFVMKYRTIEPDRQCGGDIVNTNSDWDFSGLIESPNYGGFYPSNMDCSWRLDAIGPDNSSTTDQTLKLFFSADRQCGGDIVNTNSDWDFSGLIESPNYGGFYPSNMDCSWRLDAIGPDNSSTTDQTLKLEFLSFDVPSTYQFSSSLWQQHFDIPRRAFSLFASLGRMGMISPFRRRDPLTSFRRHMVYADGELVHDGCNSHPPPSSIFIPIPQAVLRFHSDSSKQGKGFQIAYSLDGGRAGKCVYTIRADASHVIRLKFKTIGMRSATTSECFYNQDSYLTATDYVEFSGGKEEDKQINKRYICARYPFVEEGEFIMSATRPLIITYVSSGDERNRGLLMEYATVDMGGILSRFV